MKTLNERLAALRGEKDAKRDPAATALMRRATDDLRVSGILEGVRSAVARDFGLTFRLPDDLRRLYVDGLKLDLARQNGDESWELALPATYVIDRDGTILFASADPDYTVRPEPADVVRALPQ